MQQIDLLHDLYQETGLDQVGSPLIYYSSPTRITGTSHSNDVLSKALENNGLDYESTISEFPVGRGLDVDIENSDVSKFDVDQFLNVDQIKEDFKYDDNFVQDALKLIDDDFPSLPDFDPNEELFAESTLSMTPTSLACEIGRASPTPSDEEVVVEEGPSEEIDALSEANSPEMSIVDLVMEEEEVRSESGNSILDELDNMINDSTNPYTNSDEAHSAIHDLLTMKSEDLSAFAGQSSASILERQVPEPGTFTNYGLLNVASPYSTCSTSGSSDDGMAFSPVEVASSSTASQVVQSTQSSFRRASKRKSSNDDSDPEWNQEHESKVSRGCQGRSTVTKKSKRDQNREAASRYRNHKKEEAERVEKELESLKQEHEKLYAELKGIYVERKIYLNIVKTFSETRKKNVLWPKWWLEQNQSA